MDDKLEKILEYARKVVENCYDGYTLQLKKVCSNLGLTYYEATFADDTISGMLMKSEDSDSYEIIVNDKHSVNRKRFTAAHEIGHYISFLNKSHSYTILNENKQLEDHVFFRKDKEQSLAEVEANRIAAEILMPENIIKQFYYEGKQIEEISKIFGVSDDAVSIRLITLGFMRDSW